MRGGEEESVSSAVSPYDRLFQVAAASLTHHESLFPSGLLTRTLSIWTPPSASGYFIGIAAMTVWFCNLNERMTGGLCWQGGGEEIWGAVRNLLREGQLRTEQRASERGEFPCSVAFGVSWVSWVSFALLPLELMRKLIGFGTAGLLPTGA